MQKIIDCSKTKLSLPFISKRKVKISKKPLKYWENKLKVGNKRSVHLNCVPNRSSRKFDITKLDIMGGAGLSQDFIEKLTTQVQLKYKWSWIDTNIEEENKKLEKDRKNFQTLINEVQSIKEDKGINTFGFGYPIITKKDNKDGKLTCAPLIIWSLRVAKSKTKAHSWIIERSEDDAIYINEVLINHLKIDIGINLEHFSARISENGLISKEKIRDICTEFSSKISHPPPQSKIKFTILEKMKDKKYYESALNSRDTIKFYNSGLFSIFKVPKQNIIKDYKPILNGNIDITSFNKIHFDSITPLDTDPFLQLVLNSLKSNRNIYIQGPPGTGKSQGLATILINALQNKKKTIVVCEKRSALEVLQEILKEKGLSDYTTLIRDPSQDRREIVNKVRSRCKAKRTTFKKKTNIVRKKTLIKEKINKASKLISQINNSYARLDKNMLGYLKWNDLVGLFLELRDYLPKKEINEVEIPFKKYTEEYFYLIEKKIKEGEKIWRKHQEYKDYYFLKKEVFDGTESFKLEKKIKKKFKQYENIMMNGEEAVISLIKENRELYKKKITLSHRIFEILSKSIVWIDEKANSFFTNTLLNLTSYIDVRFRNYFKAREAFQKVYKALKDYYNFSSNLPFCTKSVEYITNIIDKKNNYFKHRERLFFKEHEWYTFYNNLKKEDRKIIDSLKKSSDWESLMTFKYYKEILEKSESDNIPFDHSQSENLKESLKKYENIQQEYIKSYWTIKQINAEDKFEKHNNKRLTLANLYNKRKSNKFKRHSLRQIIKEDKDLFTSFFPIIFITPDAASNLFQGDIGYFDIVLFDEASQLRTEDSFPALLKGKQIVIAGDEHQMPPSNYFGKKLEGEIEAPEEDIKLDDILLSCESLLDFAIESKFIKNHLDFHYRSRHQDLIEFSNQAFYNGRLKLLPTVKDYKCIDFFEIAGSCIEYKNKEEADKVIDILCHEIKKLPNGSYPSVGVATFNITQRNYIKNRIDELYFKKTDPSFMKKMNELEKKGFFVKNLENIQGDERDIIILSTTYGKNKEGKFFNKFGPINSFEKGYKLLNVIITRAKTKIYLCCSIPSNIYSNYKVHLEEEGSNNGKAVFFAYLAYAKAVSDGNLIAKKSVLETLKLYQDNCDFTEKNSVKGTCKFVDFVEKTIKQEFPHIELSKNQHLGGIFLNFLLKNSQGKIFAIDCVGSNVKANNESYLLDFHKERILRRLNINYHRIWSARWWRNKNEEKKDLINKIKNNLN